MTDSNIDKALEKAYKKAGNNAYFANGFLAGVEYQKSSSKEGDNSNIEKAIFKAGYLAASKLGDLPDSYQEQIVTNAFNEWKKKIVGKDILSHSSEKRLTPSESLEQAMNLLGDNIESIKYNAQKQIWKVKYKDTFGTFNLVETKDLLEFLHTE